MATKKKSAPKKSALKKSDTVEVPRALLEDLGEAFAEIGDHILKAYKPLIRRTHKLGTLLRKKGGAKS